MKSQTAPPSEVTDYTQLASLFIKSIRGEQTQESLSQDLSSNFNIVNRWETGQRGFYWSDFISLATVKEWNISSAMKHVTHFEFSKLPESFEILNHILSPSSRDLLKNHFSIQKINRLAAGRSKLLFSDFLFILDCLYGRSERFLFHFLEGQDASILSAFYSDKNAYRESLGLDPLLSLLRIVLSLEIYQSLPSHSDLILAKILSSTPDRIRAALDTLENFEVISKNGKLYEVKNEFLDTGAQKKSNSRKVMNHWRNQILLSAENTEVDNPDLLSAHLMYATNAALEEKVFELCRKFYIDLKNLVGADEGAAKDSIRFVGIDLFRPLGKATLTQPND
jgi:hypothetical protein